MRQLSPQAIHLLRSWEGANAGRTRKKRARNAKPLRINKDKRRRLINIVAAILREGEPTKFAMEAACRHGLRSALCLKGFQWAMADAIAADVVGAALNQIGAVRPTWQQGQPEWTQDGHAVVHRDRCRKCGSKLPDDDHYYRLFCSHRCRQNWHEGIFRQKTRLDNAAREHIITEA